MNKKMFAGIVALGAIIVGSVNAAELSEAACKKSTKYVWVDGIPASDGGRGVCVKKNPCAGDEYSQFCDKRFKDIQVCAVNAATELVLYAWDCDRVYRLDADNKIGQDYIACEKKLGNGMIYRVFEFDDTNETFDSTCAQGSFDGVCIAMNGDILDADGLRICRMEGGKEVTFYPGKNGPIIRGAEDVVGAFENIVSIKNK